MVISEDAGEKICGSFVPGASGFGLAEPAGVPRGEPGHYEGVIQGVEHRFSCDAGVGVPACSGSRRHLLRQVQERPSHLRRSMASHAPAQPLALEASGLLTAIVGSSDGGSQWLSQPLPSTAGQLVSIACPTTNDCTAVGSNALAGYILSTTDGGSSWNNETVPAGIGPLTGVACPTTTACTTVGENSSFEAAVILATTNAGATWAAQTAPTGVTALSGVACPSAADCEAVGASTTGGSVIGTTDSGASWVRQTLPPSEVSTIPAISCPSTLDCYIATDGSGIFTSVDGGSTWTIEATGLYLSSISCPNTLDCDAVTLNNIIVATSDGATWTNVPLQTGASGYYAIACPASLECFAATTSGLEGTINGGTNWIAETMPDGEAPSATTVSASPNPGTYGQPVTYSASVMGSGETTTEPSPFSSTRQVFVRSR